MQTPASAGLNTRVETFHAIAETLDPYLTAARHGTVDGLREVWHERARIVGWVDGRFLTLDRDAFVCWVAQSGSSPKITSQIVSIDVSGAAAAARVEFSGWLGFRFTDFFLLRKNEKRWEVVSKVYDSHQRAGRSGAMRKSRAAEASYAEAAAVRAVIDEYVEGARAGDEKRLRVIWFDHARITGWREGALVDLDAGTFSRGVAQAGGVPKVQAQIVSIDLSGCAASARIELRDWDGARFTDFLTLLDGPDGWRVSGKVFDAHDNP